jgi:hypothetical protein
MEETLCELFAVMTSMSWYVTCFLYDLHMIYLPQDLCYELRSSLQSFDGRLQPEAPKQAQVEGDADADGTRLEWILPSRIDFGGCSVGIPPRSTQ